IADRVAVMQEGKLVEEGECHALFTQPKHPYTQLLINSDPRGKPVPLPNAQSTILDVNHLRVWFPITGGLFKRVISHIKAVTDMAFALRKGQSIGLVGESGSGKS
ncbi:microcin ABC transporter ATP-binding protein, partial [Vibrio xuii]